MSKLKFCNLLFKYISNGVNVINIVTNDFIYTYIFENDNLFLSKNHFVISSNGMMNFDIKYKDVKEIRIGL